jgi:glycosyltransferase involved in cell wall biosynthesis
MDNKMTDVAVVILVGQERLHIRRCLERLRPLEPRQIFVVESQPSDGTHEIAVELGATAVFNKWPGNQALQFNWALDNLKIKAKWVLRVDADEYLSDGLIREIKDFILVPKKGVSLVEFPLARTWMRQRVRFGMPTVYIPRLLRYGLCRYDNREMDEKLIAIEGGTCRFVNCFLDDNLNADITAKSAGMKVCGVFDESSIDYVDKMKSVCDYYIYDFNELLKIIISIDKK